MVLESEGALGGVLVMWDKRVVEILECAKGQYSNTPSLANFGMFNISSDGLFREFMGLMWMPIGIRYGRNWLVCVFGGQYLGVLVMTLMWLDFIVRKLGEGRHTTAMLNFSDFILELGLINLPLQKDQFTCPIIKTLLQSLALIDSYCPPNGKCIFRVFLKRLCPGLCQTNSRLFWTMVGFIMEGLTLSSKICGFVMVTLWRRLGFGGRAMMCMAALVLSWPTSLKL